MRRNGQLLLSVTMVVVFAVFTAMSMTYSRDARLAPLVVGAIGLVLSLLELVATIRTGGGKEEDGFADDRTRLGGGEVAETGRRKGRALLGWFGVFVAATILAGIVPTALLLVFAFLRFRSREPLRTAIAVAVIFAAVVYVTFEVALGIPLFAGVLWGGF